MNVLGCDVSTWQDADSTPQRMNFEKTVQMGAKFVFIKASQSIWLDQDFVYNWDAAGRAGLPRGAYHYFTWDKPAIEQARFFSGLLKQDCGELSPVLDYECRAGVPARASAIQRAKIFVEEVEQLLGKPMQVYTSNGFWGEYGSIHAFWAARKLWLASYGVITPKVPAPWTRWEFWQYTDRGPGLAFGAESLQIDLNWWNGTQAEFDAVYGGNPDLPPGPSGPPTRTVIITALWGLRVRTEPNTISRVLKTLRYGSEVRVIDQPGDWLKLADEPGWISRQWVRQ